MSRGAMAAAVVISLAACDEGAELQLEPRVDFPDAVAGRAPYLPGGALRTQVTLTGAGLEHPLRARIDLVEPAPGQAAATTTATITLFPVDPSDPPALRGEGFLPVPGGGPATVRATVAGFSAAAGTTVDLPVISARTVGPMQPLAGTQLGVPVCVESTAGEGVLVDVSLTRAALPSGAAAGSFALAPGACDGGTPPVGPRSSLDLEVVPSGASFALAAAISKTAISFGPFELSPFDDLSNLTFEFSGLPATLPDAGTLMDVAVTARVGGAGVPWLPFTLTATPATTVVPSSLTTDGAGSARAVVAAPVSNQLHLEAVSGAARSGVTLSR